MNWTSAVLLVMAAVVVLAGLRRDSNQDRVVDKVAIAIATAEGFYVAGSKPRRNNNPGNLTVDIAGGGLGVGRDGMFVVYLTADDGWLDLKQQVRLMLTGQSRIYNSAMSILEVASKYTTTQQQEWAANVANVLGVEPSTRLRELSA